MKKIFLVLLLCLFVGDSFATGIGNVATAPCDNATLSKYTGTANVEINWEPNVIQLGWYDGNTRLDVPVSAQSCTYDGVVTVPPQPTRPGYTFNGWKVIGVPTGYTKLEYLESTGTQYIDTNITISNYERVVTKLSTIDCSMPHNPGPFGSYSDVNGRNTIVPWKYSDKNPFGYLAIGGSSYYYLPYGYNNPVNTSLNIIYDMDITADNGQYSGKYCGITISGNYSTMENGLSVTLFGYKRENYVSLSATRIYYFMLYTAPNSLAFNGIPARRNSDNVLGMYDTVTQTFFTNAGSGAFVAGPVVQ